LAIISVVPVIVTIVALVRDPLFVSWAETLATLVIARALFVSGIGIWRRI